MTQPEIAKNLKIHRTNSAWSLTKTALETGVSKAMLGQIERGESSPTITTLWKIATGFHLPLTAFLQPPSTGEFMQFKNGISFKTLFTFDPILKTEMFAHYLEPHQSQLSAAHAEGVVEDIVVLTGEVEILADGKWVYLPTGKTLRFAADQPHGYRNPTALPATFHSIMHYPLSS